MSFDGTIHAEATRYAVVAPAPLVRWGDSLIGTRRGKKVVAGWGWDGRSPGLELILAPKGRVYVDAPIEVWRRCVA